MSDYLPMIDRVARAIAHENGDDYRNVIERDYYRMARNAIEAMREPTEAMADCAGTALYGATAEQAAEWALTDKRESRVHEGQEVWQAMIDAALNEK